MTRSRIIKTPRTVSIAITAKCNLRCKYCSHFSSAGDVPEDVPTQEWLDFFDELGRCAVMNITLEGGEPFIRNDILDLLDGIVKNHMRFSILSNGTLLTDDIAAFIAKTHRCNSVQVSIDGSTPAVHESCRGAGTFSKAVNAIKTLQDHNIPVTVRVTVHRYNVHDLPNIARFLLEDLGLPEFSTNSAKYFGICRENAEKVGLTIEDMVTAMHILLKLNREYGGRISGQAGPLAEAHMWMDMIKRSQYGTPEDSHGSGGQLTSCGGVFEKIGVRADGVFIPCILLPQIELGRINRDSLEYVWQNHPELTALRKRREIPLSRFTLCRDCKFIPYCNGGCPGLASTYTGDCNRPSPDTCLALFLDQGGIVPSEENDPEGYFDGC